VLTIEHVDSRQLQGNVIGDPSRRDLVIYLPPSYHTSTRRYPTAYLLHGFGMRAMSWTSPLNLGGWLLPPIDEILEPVIAKHRAAETIVVMPDGWSKYGCSQWVDSPVNGNFEQYVTQEVVEYVDSHFRTIPDASSRGIFGISSGGFGAWHLASRHPDVFGAMALLCADSYFEMSAKPFFYTFYETVYPGKLAGPVEGNFTSWLCYGLASCYSPNPDSPPYYVDFPVQFPSGEVIQPIWRKWLQYDPVVSWRDRLDNLRRLHGILLDVGSKDEFRHHYGHRQLSCGLTSAGITHTAQEHPGNHAGHLHERLQLALSWLSDVLETSSTALAARG
jgi:pimeloyl-ACP methyl ester carboxylesterase